MEPGEGVAIAMIVRAFHGTEVLKWATWQCGWSNGLPLRTCITCGVPTSARDPKGEPNHFRHYQSDGRPPLT